MVLVTFFMKYVHHGSRKIIYFYLYIVPFYGFNSNGYKIFHWIWIYSTTQCIRMADRKRSVNQEAINFKIAVIALWPVGRRVVSVELARQVREANASRLMKDGRIR